MSGVKALVNARGNALNAHIGSRDAAAPPGFCADARNTVHELNWRFTRTLDELAQDTWHWQ
ncbi:hypothetical protein [Salmonella enterica]|uniref:hypothetical protein n=1 Tax=Salmonella enterica TaxID=28901 RepID=UPI00398C720B